MKKYWIRRPTTKSLWLKLIEHPEEVTAEEKARLLGEHSLAWVKLLLEPVKPRDGRITMIVMMFVIIWCWVSIFAVTLWCSN